MKRSVRWLTVLSTLLGASFAHAKELPNFDAYYQAKPAPMRVLGSNTNRRISVVSTDARTGAPTFFWAPRAKHQVKTLISKPKAAPEVSAKRALEDVAVDLTLP